MFQIVTDTSSNLPTAYLQAGEYHRHPVHLPHRVRRAVVHGHGQRSTRKAFYAAMRNGEKVTTSQIPPQRFVDYLHPMLEAGEDVLFVSMSSGISGSVRFEQNCREPAAGGIPRAENPDGRTRTPRLWPRGIVVMHAVECREKGMSDRRNIYSSLRALRAPDRRRSLPWATSGISSGRAACPIWRPLSARFCRSSRCSRATPRARSSALRRCAAGSARSRRWPSAYEAAGCGARSADSLHFACRLRSRTRRSWRTILRRSAKPPKDILIGRLRAGHGLPRRPRRAGAVFPVGRERPQHLNTLPIRLPQERELLRQFFLLGLDRNRTHAVSYTSMKISGTRRRRRGDTMAGGKHLLGRPRGKHIFGTAKVGEKGQIVIPEGGADALWRAAGRYASDPGRRADGHHRDKARGHRGRGDENF